MVFLFGILAVCAILFLLPAILAFAGFFLVLALVGGAIWLVVRVLATSLWWGLVCAVFLALACYFLWPVLLFV